jgi:uncharacterized membrane protein YgdD (TMEM256/DUF423 family)
VQVSRFSRRVLIAGAALALVSVLAGAFAAHGLKATLDARQLAVFETAARYQMYHAFALLIVGGLSVLPQFSRRLLRFAAIAFGIGILLFSGSLYLLALSGIGWLGAITPLGGSAFIAGWALLIAAAWQTTPNH